MITRLTNDRLEEAAELAFKLNQNEETKCLSMSMEYEGILSNFRRSLEQDKSDFLLYIEEEEIIGICHFDPEHDSKYVQTSGGIFAVRDYQKIASEFYDFLLENYKGYEFYSSYSYDNKEAKDFWMSVGANVDFDAIIYENDLSKTYALSTNIEELKESDYDQFKTLLNQQMPDAFWNGDRMIQNNQMMGNFKVQVEKQNDEITGYVASRVSKHYSETYFMYSKASSFGTKKELMKAAVTIAARTCEGPFQYFVDRTDKLENKVVKELEFTDVGTSITFHIKELK